MRRIAFASAAALSLLVMGTTPAPASSVTRLESVPRFDHVFVIVGENTGIRQVTSSDAPYLVGSLKPAAAWLTRFRALHDGSLSDYVGMLAGRFRHCDVLDRFPANCHHRWNSLMHQLDVRGVSWTGWME
jgi:hypothetical protein